MADTISIMVKKVGKGFEEREMEKGLKNMQALVGGLIEAVALKEGVDLWVNEEGLLNESELNMVLLQNGAAQAYYAGDAFFASVNDEGETIGLTDKQKQWIRDNIIEVGVTKNKEGETYPVYGIVGM